MSLLGVSERKLEDFAASLLERGLVSSDQLALAQVSRKNLGTDLGEVLLSKGILTRDQFLEALSSFLNVAWTRVSDATVDPNVVRKLASSQARRYRVLVLQEIDEHFLVAMADPTDSFIVEEIEQLLGKKIRPQLAVLEELEESWEFYYRIESVPSQEETTDQVDILYEDEGLTSRADELRKMASGRRVIETFNSILSHAYQEGASDIHIEPYQNELRIRYRIDGLLETKQALERSLHLPIVSRIKILAGIDIAERRIPQDGRVHVRVVGNPLDLRISTFPTLHGEKVVIRLLGTQQVLRLDDLGFTKSDRRTFGRIIEKSHGIFLVTGPTGSGKSTTLYAALQRINSPEKNIIAIEDPIENQIEGINQSQVSEKAGLTFTTSLRAVLRQDPDVIMLGEIRDGETCEIAVRAAITGHLVMSTLHTNTAAGAITRLIDLGIEPFLVASSLQGVMAQRLVRRICKNCRQETEPDPGDKYPDLKRFEGIGCESCRFSGYTGRIAIFELAPISREARQLICENAGEDVLLKRWREEEIKPLSEDGLEKVASGQTTLDEVMRVTA